MNKATLILLALLPLSSAAQNTDLTSHKFQDNYTLAISGQATTKYKGWENASLSVDAGYHVLPRLTLFARCESNLHLFDKNDTRTFDRSLNLGGGLSFSLTNPVKSPEALDLQLSVTNSVGDADWKNTSYGASVLFYHNYSGHRVAPYIGLGYRYSASHTTGIKDFSGLTGTIGIRFYSKENLENRLARCLSSFSKHRVYPVRNYHLGFLSGAESFSVAPIVGFLF